MLKYEREFLPRVREIIVARCQRFSKQLTPQSQELTGELRSHQEEIRQNMEELEATQEHLTTEAKERENLQFQLKKIN